ncbi:MAG: polysaccharide biosynthesis C-terminal domain-containing protein [Bacteroidia bacterium]
MRLRFLYNAGFILLVNLTIKPFWIFAIDRQVQNLAGPEAYGAYYALLNFSLLLGALLDAGLANYNARQVAIQREKGLRHLPELLGLKLSLFAAYLIITLGGALLLGYRGTLFYWLLIICLNQGLSFLNSYLRSNIAGLQLFKLDGLLGVLDKLLMSLGALPLLWGNYYLSGILMLDFILIQSLAYASSSLVLLLLLRSKTKVGISIVWKRQRFTLRATLPYALLGILMGLYTKIDAVLLVQLLPDGNYAAGIYAAGYRLLDAVSMVPVLISGILLPQFAHLLSQKSLEPAFVRTAALLLGAIAFITAIIGWQHAPLIMDLLYHHQDVDQYQVFSLLMWAFVPLSLNYVFGTLLTAAGKLPLMNYLAVAGLLLNVGLNYGLIPSLGAAGAAIATLATQTLVFSLQFIACYRLFSWKFDLAFALRLLFASLSLLLITQIKLFDDWQAMLFNGLLAILILLLWFGQPVYQRLKSFRIGGN